MKLLFPFRLSVPAILGVSLALTGCARPPAGPPPAAPAPVPVSLPVEREVTDYAESTARIAAVDSVEVRARVPGYLNKVNFREGDLVKKGDVLFEIDPRPYEALLNQAKAQVGQADAQLKFDEAEYRRYVGLGHSLAVSKSDVEKIGAAADVSRANIAAVRALLAQRELDLGYTKVMAPVTGRVSQYAVTVGNLIQAGNQGGGTLLTTIVSVDPVYAYFDVDEQTIQRVRRLIREGKLPSADRTAVPVSLGLSTENGLPHQGTIHFVDNQVNPKTGTLRVRGVFPNADEALTPGFFARVRVPVGPPRRALLVTDRSVDNDQGQKVLYVVNDKNEVVSRPVRLGQLHDGLRSVEDGLKPGERVIVNGLQQVRPGATVEPKLVPMPTRAEVGGQKSEAGSTATVADRGQHP
jgi:RND family efflux transporter MFP subunit